MCPWNVKFAQALPEGSTFTARAMFVEKDARTLAREILAMDHEDYAAALADDGGSLATFHSADQSPDAPIGITAIPSGRT